MLILIAVVFWALAALALAVFLEAASQREVAVAAIMIFIAIGYGTLGNLAMNFRRENSDNDVY